jgi:UDP-N-acetylmuramyl pentapeptide synthase
MLTAIRSFSEIRSAQKVIILGDMLELGEKAEAENIRILQELKSIKP